MIETTVLHATMKGIAEQVVRPVCVHLSGNKVLQDFELRGHHRPASKDLPQETREFSEKQAVQYAAVTGRLLALCFGGEDLRDAFTFNVLTAHALTTAAVPLMLEHSGGGSVINITSTMGRLAGRGFAAYGTAKGALAHYTRLAALDLCPRIRVNAIAPGSIMTSALDVVASNDELRAPMEKVTPMRRLGDPVDIAAAAVYLASPAGSYLTGKTLEVDGGITFPNLDLPIPDL